MMVMRLWTHKFNIDFQLWFIYTKNETHPPKKAIPACHKIHALNLWYYTASAKLNATKKFKSKQMYLHPI